MAAKKKISQLPSAGAIGGTELLEVVQGGVSKRSTPAGITPGLTAATNLAQGAATAAQITDLEANTVHRGLAAGNPHAVTPAELSLVIGTNVQAFGAVLDDFNTLGPATIDGQFIVGTGAGAFSYESGATARASMDVAQKVSVSTNNAVVRFDGITGEVQNSGVTIDDSDNIVIPGNLTVSGTTTTVNSTTVEVADSLFKYAKDNNTTDVLDIGWYGLYDTSGSLDLFAGMFRDASDNKFHMFVDLQIEPTTTVNKAGAGYTVATLVANLDGTINTATQNSITTMTALATVGTLTNLVVNGSVIVNELGTDVDFRVESVGEPNAFFIEGSSGNIGIGINTPSTKLQVKANTPGTVGDNPAGQIIIQALGTSINSNAVITGYNSDGSGNPNNQLWYLGSSSGSNSNITLLNRIAAASLSFGTSGSTRLTISGSGTVTIASGGSLTVNGNITSTEFIQLTDIAAPTNPGAGKGNLYKKTGNDGIFWKPDAAGPEVDLTTGDSAEAAFGWIIDDPISIQTAEDAFRVMRRAGTIVGVIISAEERGDDGIAIADINRHVPTTKPITTQRNNTPGVTIFTDQDNRPKIVGETTNKTDNAIFQTVLPDETAFAAGDFFSMDIDDIGGGANKGFCVQIYVKYT